MEQRERATQMAAGQTPQTVDAAARQDAVEQEALQFRAPFAADYIWIKEDGVAVWAAFSKDITLNQDQSEAVLDIACDTHYWLWINGEEIVWEGSLKRGVTPRDGYYDHVVVRRKFKAGSNNVSILVRHLGDNGFSHKDAGCGGLVVEGTVGDVPLLSDGTWKAKRFGYGYSAWKFWNHLNFRLSERGSEVDGRAYDEFWLGQSARDWPNAVVLDRAKAAAAFGRSYRNPLPPKVAAEPVYWDVGSRARRRYTFDLPVNMQFCPVFVLDADKAGRKITYYTENRWLNYKNTYSTRKGQNRFLDFAWINGDKLKVRLGRGIRLVSAGYRATGYGADAVAAFDSEDEALNVLWQKAANTLAVTMRDSYMDCPDRERAQWIGDAVIESDMSFYCLRPESAALFRKAIVATYGWLHPDGVIQTVVPNGLKAYELPVQNLAFLVGCVNYIEYSGDHSVWPMVLTMAQGYLPLWQMKDGLVVHRKGSWDWGDWGGKIDVPALENAWYYYAMARLLRYVPHGSEFAAFCHQRMRQIAAAYAAYRKPVGVASGAKADDRANAVAVLAGLYREEDIAAIVQALYNVRNSSPYMEKYVEQALCELGRTDLALARAKEVYAAMIADKCTTLWEFWRKHAGTTNHAWAGGTLFVLSRYVGGIYPTSDGFATFAVRPDTSVLADFCVTVNPVEGVEISLRARQDAGRQTLTVHCTSAGGQLIATGKNFIFNGQSVPSAATAERVFDLAVGANELSFE